MMSGQYKGFGQAQPKSPPSQGTPYSPQQGMNFSSWQPPRAAAPAQKTQPSGYVRGVQGPHPESGGFGMGPSAVSRPGSMVAEAVPQPQRSPEDQWWATLPGLSIHAPSKQTMTATAANAARGMRGGARGFDAGQDQMPNQLAQQQPPALPEPAGIFSHPLPPASISAASDGFHPNAGWAREEGLDLALRRQGINRPARGAFGPGGRPLALGEIDPGWLAEQGQVAEARQARNPYRDLATPYSAPLAGRR
jgi:hypothetical protein